MFCTLIVAAVLSFGLLLAVLPNAGGLVRRPWRAHLLAERRHAIRKNDEIPSFREEFAAAWQDWCDKLTLLLRDSGYIPPWKATDQASDGPSQKDSRDVLSTYRQELRKPALILFDDGLERGVPPERQRGEDPLGRGSFHDATSMDQLWKLVRQVRRELIVPNRRLTRKEKREAKDRKARRLLLRVRIGEHVFDDVDRYQEIIDLSKGRPRRIPQERRRPTRDDQHTLMYDEDSTLVEVKLVGALRILRDNGRVPVIDESGEFIGDVHADDLREVDRALPSYPSG